MTIRLRLTLYWAAVLAAILIVAAIAALQMFEREQWGALDAALLEETDTTAKAIAQTDRNGALAIAWDLSREPDIGPGRRVRLLSGAETIVDFGDRSTIPPAPAQASSATRSIVVGTHSIRFGIAPLTFMGRAAYLENGVDARPVSDAIARLQRSLALVVPLVLLLSVAGGYWLAGRALAPFESVNASLASIQPTDLSARLKVPPTADEVARLSSVINALLARLERASATERRFASDAAHELRTPLAVLRTGLEVALARDRSADENRTALLSAHREVISLCKIADELLMLARLNGEVAVNRARVDLSELLREIASTVEPLAQAREIHLRVDATPATFIDGNQGHLRRLIINLLDNALKFTPSGGVIEASVTRESAKAVIRVADNGPGIPAAEMPFIFDRFFRGASSVGEGSGLGLSLCREIARLHGGEIVAANRADGGCEFLVTLPLAPPPWIT